MKTLLSLLLDDKKAFYKGILLGVASGLLSFAFLAFLNLIMTVLMSGMYKGFNPLYAASFSLIILTYIWSRRALSQVIIELSQRFFWGLRIQVLGMILKSNYNELEERRNRVHSTLVHDIGALSQASLNLISFLTALVVVIACLVYMAFTSWQLFLITLITSVVGIVVYQFASRKNVRKFGVTRDLEDDFMHNFNAILSGFKEISMDRKKGEAILERKVKPIANKGYMNNTSAFVGFLNNQITGQILFYALIASIVLYFSITLDVESITIVNFLFILLYLLGSIETLMVLLPSLAQARVSMSRLTTLRDELEQHQQQFDNPGDRVSKEAFESVKVTGFEFEYKGGENKDAFAIGPISMEVQKEEINFIYGGNGSGKTTFVHALLGLLVSEKGEIEFNGQPLNKENYVKYKSQFAVVFNEFFLFDEFYGYEDFDKQKAKKLLEMFEMQEKVEMTDKGFTSTDLSTGQRKRLAIIAAILEEKPILVLDEWAADQDPYFREKFYTELLPEIRNMGHSIIAITHDDKYYNCADKLYKMEYGRLKNVTSEVKPVTEDHE